MQHRPAHVPPGAEQMRAILIAAIALLGATPPSAPRVVARTVVVHGTVTDRATSQPLEQVQIVVVGTAVGASTDRAGEYRLSVQIPERDTSITILTRRVGYVADSRAVPLTHDTIRADIVLTAAVSQLSEVVVTGIKSAATLYGSLAGNSVIVAGMAAPDPDRRFDRERYARIEDNQFLSAASVPLSTFSVDVDRASYANVRRFVSMLRRPP